MRSGLAAVALTALGLVAAAGCASSAPHTSAGGSSGKGTSSTSSSPAASPAYTPTAPAGTALGSGERVWAAFSDRGLAHDAWWAQLEPKLSDSARAVYVYDDPKKIPEMKLTGKLRVAAKPPDQPRFTVEVVVPTSRGQWRLDLERRTLTSKWLLYAIKFPPGVD
jgi:hypothetical protein